MKYDSIIGIDPGVNTGIAIWNFKKKEFENMFSASILKAMQKIEIYSVFGDNLFMIENPNLRKWYGSNSNSKLQGAGSIKRDYSIWMEWFKMNDLTFKELDPKNIRTKVNSDSFKKLTGWNERTNEHSRDAAMMVFGL
jgi:hypothetical protein